MKRRDLKPGTTFYYMDDHYKSFSPKFWVPGVGACPSDCLESNPSRLEAIGEWEVKVISVPNSSTSVIDPPHYKDLQPEPILVSEGWGLNRNLHTVVKYISRAGRKPGQSAEDDLLKALRYLTREITTLRGKPSWTLNDNEGDNS